MKKTSMRIYALILSVICLLTSLGLPNLVNAQGEGEEQLISVNLLVKQKYNSDGRQLIDGEVFNGIVGKTYTEQEILNEILREKNLGEKISYFKLYRPKQTHEITKDKTSITLEAKQVKADLNIEFKTQNGTLVGKTKEVYTDIEKATDYENYLNEEALIRKQPELKDYKLKTKAYESTIRIRDKIDIPNLKTQTVEIRVGKVSTNPHAMN